MNHIELLRSALYLRVLEPDLYSSMQYGRVGGVEPLEQHHVGDLGVESKDEAAEVTRESDDGLANLLRKPG